MAQKYISSSSQDTCFKGKIRNAEKIANECKHKLHCQNRLLSHKLCPLKGYQRPTNCPCKCSPLHKCSFELLHARNLQQAQQFHALACFRQVQRPLCSVHPTCLWMASLSGLAGRERKVATLTAGRTGLLRDEHFQERVAQAKGRADIPTFVTTSSSSACSCKRGTKSDRAIFNLCSSKKAGRLSRSSSRKNLCRSLRHSAGQPALASTISC